MTEQEQHLESTKQELLNFARVSQHLNEQDLESHAHFKALDILLWVTSKPVKQNLLQRLLRRLR